MKTIATDDIVMHVVECRSGKVRYFREMDLADADAETLVRDLLAGQIDAPFRVVAFNTFEGWSRDVSEDIARELVDRAARHNEPLTHAMRSFCERHGVEMPFVLAAE